MSESSAPVQDRPYDQPVEPVKVTGASESKIAGLTRLPDKRPTRRFFGLLPGRRGS